MREADPRQVGNSIGIVGAQGSMGLSGDTHIQASNELPECLLSDQLHPLEFYCRRCSYTVDPPQAILMSSYSTDTAFEELAAGIRLNQEDQPSKGEKRLNKIGT